MHYCPMKNRVYIKKIVKIFDITPKIYRFVTKK
jgi:hypothetical protein